MDRNNAERPVGYIELLGRNRDFRRLWIGQLISQTGDWFNSVALFTLMLSLTGSGEAVAYLLILKFLPSFFIGPIAGVVADRYDRKSIMIATDVLRGILVLGFLLVKRPEQIWLVYTLTTVEVVLSTFFDPAKSASIPNIASDKELVSANAVSGASWSVTLAIGAALGGVVTDAFGRNSAFVIDSASFFVSAAFISLVRFRKSQRRSRQDAAHHRLSLADLAGMTDVIEGARYLTRNPRVVALLLVKAGWGLGGGVLLLLTVYGKQVFPLGRDGSTSIGLLYAARGIGAMLGPVIAQRITGSSLATMRRAIGFAFLVSAVFYLTLPHAPGLAVAAALVIGAHGGGSIQWTFSTTLLQIAVPDKFRGRVFALEMALLTLSISLSTYLTGWGLDHAHLDVKPITTLLGLVFLVPGAVWFLHLRRLARTGPEPAEETAPIAEPALLPPETSFPPS